MNIREVQVGQVRSIIGSDRVRDEKCMACAYLQNGDKIIVIISLEPILKQHAYFAYLTQIAHICLILFLFTNIFCT